MRRRVTLTVRGWKGYALAAATVAAAMGLTVALDPLLDESSFLFFFPAVVVTAWMAGLGPALFATVLTVLGVDWWLFAPQGVLTLQGTGAVALAVFAGVVVTVAWLANEAHGALARLQQRTDELEVKEREAWRREREFRSLAEHAPDLIARFDTDLRYVYVNPAVERATGLPAERFLGREVGRTGLLPGAEDARRALRAVLDRREALAVDFRLEGPAGERSYRAQIVPEIERDGRVSALLGLARDTTDRERHERRREILVKASRLFGASLDPGRTMDDIARLVVRSLADGSVVHLIGADGTIRRQAVAAADPAVEERLREITERYPPDLSNPEDPVARVLQGGDAILDRVDERLLQAVVSDPEQRPAIEALDLGSYMVAPLTGRTSVLGAVSFFRHRGGRPFDEEDLELARELGERAGLAVENARLHERAQEEIRIREDILAIVAHDLRNPLNVVLTTAQALRATLAEDPGRDSEFAEEPWVRLVDAQERAIHRAELLIRDLLDFSRIESGRFRIEPEPADVPELLSEAVEQARLQADGSEVEFVLRTPTECPALHADRSRILQALSNLIENAVRYSPENGAVTIGAEQDGASVCLFVADEGPGVPEDDLPHLFEPFWKGEPSDGSGLGLAIVKGIAEAHGGSVHVETRPGRGARFQMRLPLESRPIGVGRRDAPSDGPRRPERTAGKRTGRTG